MERLNKHLLSRRTMLRAAGVAIGLPLLDAMLPRGLRADEKAEALAPRRMVLIARPLGMHPAFFFPEKPGKDYEASRYLKIMEPLRGEFTVMSGMSHLGYPTVHGTDIALFTGVSPAGQHWNNDFRNSVSLDHFVAERVGILTRVPSLVVGTGPAVSCNHKGIGNPREQRATELFKDLFVDGTAAEVAREVRRMQDGHSILDDVRDQLKTLNDRVGPEDRDRIDSYTTSIREAEQRLQQYQKWAGKPKPKVDYKPQEYDPTLIVDVERQWYDLARLALQTDTTRTIVISHNEGRAKIGSEVLDHHGASHHSQDEKKIEQLASIEEAEMKVLADFLQSLKSITEGEKNLLDKTMVLSASNLSNASAHRTDNLPVIIAGGGLKHQGHMAFDRKNNKELSNLYVRMLQQLNIDVPQFGCSTGALADL